MAKSKFQIEDEWPSTLMGLVIDKPWIDYILEGKKTWEMRSQATKNRGLIALIRNQTTPIVSSN